VIRRLYVHNYRCLENFELKLAGLSSALLIGANGSGKSTIVQSLKVLQQIALGKNGLGDLIRPLDFAQYRTEAPMRFELEVDLGGVAYSYALAIEYPKGFRAPRIFEERLMADENKVFARERAQVHFPNLAGGTPASFQIDWHFAGLPVIQERSAEDPLRIFRQWLANLLILRPYPQGMSGESNTETMTPTESLANFGEWFSGLLATSPAAYSSIEAYLKQVMPDFLDLKNPLIGRDTRSLEIRFQSPHGSINLPFEALSDGEKCFLVCATLIAAHKANPSLVCLWDEPDNYLALSEVGHFIIQLRQAFSGTGQFIATSHNPEAIRRFSDENTFLVSRASHLEPTQARLLTGMPLGGDLIDAMIRGDLPA